MPGTGEWLGTRLVLVERIIKMRKKEGKGRRRKLSNFSKIPAQTYSAQMCARECAYSSAKRARTRQPSSSYGSDGTATGRSLPSGAFRFPHGRAQLGCAHTASRDSFGSKVRPCDAPRRPLVAWAGCPAPETLPDAAVDAVTSVSECEGPMVGPVAPSIR